MLHGTHCACRSDQGGTPTILRRSMEYTKQFLSEEQAQRLLALFVETVDQAAAGQLTCAGALLRVLQESGDDKVLTATKAL